MKIKSPDGVHGICSSLLRTSLVTACIHILMTTFRGHNSIPAFLPAQRTISLRIVARESTTRPVNVGRAIIRRMSKRFVLMPTALVRYVRFLQLLVFETLTGYFIAFDDQTSTFIIPSGAGFEVVFCPGARSTNILDTSRAEMQQLAQNGHASKQSALVLNKRRAEMFRRSVGEMSFQLSRATLVVAVVLAITISLPLHG